MTAGSIDPLGVEWGGDLREPQPVGLGWPTMRAAERCDGENPMTGRVCIKGHHKGYHRDASGAEWLDD
ncbi:hypothetical protein E0H50_03290 [Kribbella sindirgiensis]|uniref:Uncharacterized protein n=1 Tax=Kribbella sindirgiensis TaxID=1124744 RepID=A0A4R0JG23_9ACTN|nr:hypothetical protein E0H50_03290 [Kribbella sindirgiensis]